MKRSIFSLGFILCLLAICSTLTPAQIFIHKKNFYFKNSYNRVWLAINEVLIELQIPYVSFSTLKKKVCLFTTNASEVTGLSDSDLCDCGKLKIDSEIKGTLRMAILLKKVSKNSCKIWINCFFEQDFLINNLFSHQTCVSTGKLEAEFFHKVASKLK